MAAGIIALALEANPTLGWRDMQHIIVRTSKRQLLRADDWQTNAAGFEYSHVFGFGLMDAEAMVLLAEQWQNVPEQKLYTRYMINEHAIVKPTVVNPGSTKRAFHVNLGPPGSQNFWGEAIRSIEHVQVLVPYEAEHRGDVAFYLHSPQG